MTLKPTVITERIIALNSDLAWHVLQLESGRILSVKTASGNDITDAVQAAPGVQELLSKKLSESGVTFSW